MIKQAFHPSGRTIKFSSENHLYVDDTGKTYTSSTTFISRFFRSFDMADQAERCAGGGNPKYAGKNPAIIIAGWEAEGERGRNEGTNVHDYAECLFLGLPAPAPISDRCRKLFKQVDQVHLELIRHYQVIGAEVIVFDPETGLSGMIDLLMWHPWQRHLIILDWKQNKEISRANRFQKGLKPIDHLEDTDLNHYSLQLSLYEYLIKKGGYFPDAVDVVRALIHLRDDRDKPEIIKLDDYRWEIGEMIKAHAA